ncbi:MAG: hypothetical protein JJU26_03435 [Oceanicaulis sp.]|uniref:hypothetical protein n=1 Tax=Glycocaulis sp. TaxID=1969725 RepID=UPI0025C5A5D5|nr:hypothetical protein [Glycocaulis sp.]MCC5980753.1 hypothetical protein [Oceanicaulis sp.]MCH8520997.1 hypothetical protein [Glycocaulis sp.]
MKFRIRTIVPAIAGSVLMASGASAQCDTSQLEELAFVNGSWNAYAWDGSFAGQRYFVLDADGCGAVELAVEDEMFSPHRNLGLNSQEGLWIERGIMDGASVEMSGPLGADGVLAMEGLLTETDGREMPVRASWAARDDGTMIHKQEIRYDSDRTWSILRAYTYVRPGNDPNGAEPGMNAMGPELGEDAFGD